MNQCQNVEILIFFPNGHHTKHNCDKHHFSWIHVWGVGEEVQHAVVTFVWNMIGIHLYSFAMCNKAWSVHWNLHTRMPFFLNLKNKNKTATKTKTKTKNNNKQTNKNTKTNKRNTLIPLAIVNQTLCCNNVSVQKLLLIKLWA